jgi:serine/threonine-protein kinase
MIGQSFGNYRAISILGEGGMGIVYLAEHPEIGRKVAVKVLHRDFARDQQVLGRFLNEARAANAIRHPNIIEILDSGALADQTPFLVMELLEGESLAARIRRTERLAVRDAVDFAYQTASALSAAHGKGIVHRDLKPDNLFIVPDPHEADRERIKVLDFGIAKLQQSSPGDSVKTRTGTLMGTPIYMSPEQCRGVRTVDHRTDIYSLGVILYEMLIGRPPFVSEGFGDLVNMHINMAPPPPRAARPDLSPDLEAVILTTLAKAPEQRFDGMQAFQAALKSASAGLFTVRGSSPDIGSGARGPRSVLTSASQVGFEIKQTTLTGGAGEQIPYRRSKGKALALGIGLAALAGAALLVLRRPATDVRDPLPAGSAAAVGTGKPEGAPADPAAPGPAAVIVPSPSKAAVEPKVTIVVESTPPGASVVSAADGERLGSTPLTLTREPGGKDLELRVEKEGFAPVVRSVSLTRDETLAIILEKRPHAHAPHRSSVDEPAKL